MVVGHLQGKRSRDYLMGLYQLRRLQILILGAVAHSFNDFSKAYNISNMNFRISALLSPNCKTATTRPSNNCNDIRKEFHILKEVNLRIYTGEVGLHIKNCQFLTLLGILNSLLNSLLSYFRRNCDVKQHKILAVTVIILIAWTKILLKKRRVAQMLNKSPSFMKSEVLLQFPRELTTGPYPERKIQFTFTRPIYLRRVFIFFYHLRLCLPPQLVSSVQVSGQNYFSFLPRWQHALPIPSS